jgi:hypothetical protein
LEYFCSGDRRNAVCDPDGDDCAGEPCTACWQTPDGATNFDDVTGAVFAFARSPGTVWPHTVQVDIHGDDFGDAATDPPNYAANFSDVQHIILAFQGSPYPFSDPLACP